MSEHDEIIRLVAEYDRLSEYCAENPNDSDAEVEFERFCEEWPGIAEGLWDSEGNYVGEVRNENGWTP